MAGSNGVTSGIRCAASLVRINGVHFDAVLAIHCAAIGAPGRNILLSRILPYAVPAPQAHAVAAVAELASQVGNIECLQA